MTLYNKADWSRLHTFFTDSYADADAVEQRLTDWQAHHAAVGRLRVKQVLAVDKHRVILALESEHDGLYYAEMTVEEDYPHRVTATQFTKLQEVE
jgi:hypothetical protein